MRPSSPRGPAITKSRSKREVHSGLEKLLKHLLDKIGRHNPNANRLQKTLHTAVCDFGGESVFLECVRNARGRGSHGFCPVTANKIAATVP